MDQRRIKATKKGERKRNWKIRPLILEEAGSLMLMPPCWLQWERSEEEGGGKALKSIRLMRSAWQMWSPHLSTWGGCWMWHIHSSKRCAAYSSVDRIGSNSPAPVHRISRYTERTEGYDDGRQETSDTIWSRALQMDTLPSAKVLHLDPHLRPPWCYSINYSTDRSDKIEYIHQ